ncbi:hypothetical protein ACFPYJ_16965 [Paenibacillus solisilvae]|uniref:Uncharacterized protein n=1 Tax=Paenibacillus solisilvae TaxID=2486751 RepID=A0ABW0VZ94_9BACL
MKIRLMPTLITVVLSASLLVGGWFIYRNVATVQPLERIVAEVPGVVQANPVISNDAVTLDLTLDKDANIRNIYDRIANDGKAVIGSRELKLNIQPVANEDQTKLDDVWSSVLFDVAQAMEHRNYSDIPAAMKQMEHQFPGVKATTEMDDINVYITLKDGNSAKYMVLPRTPDQMGAWPNA